jgi:hypothetical protein
VLPIQVVVIDTHRTPICPWETVAFSGPVLLHR